MRMRAGIFAVLVVAGSVLRFAPASADESLVRMRDCAFSPTFRVIGVGESIKWHYEEGGCSGQNHRVKSFPGSPQAFDSSPGCTDATLSPSFDCLNDTPGKSTTFRFRFTAPGIYDFYCPFHGRAQGDPTHGECGMCGRIVVSAPAPPPPPPTSAPPSAHPTPSRSPSPTASPSPSPSASPSATPSATPRPDDARGGAGGNKALRLVGALGAVGILGWLGTIVYRRFLRA